MVQARVSWNYAAGGQLGFVVQRLVSGGVFEEIARVGAGELSMVDAGPAGGFLPGQNVQYRVAAFNGVGDGPFSVPMASTAPTAPTTAPGMAGIVWEQS